MRKGILLAALCLTAMPALANENPRSDLNGDGRADLVWRHVERGTNVAWLDGNHATPVGLSAEPGVHWYIAAIGRGTGNPNACSARVRRNSAKLRVRSAPCQT